MTPRRFFLWMFSLSITFAPPLASGDAGEGRFRLRFEASSGTVTVDGWTGLERLSLSEREPSADRWADVLTVRVSHHRRQADAVPIVGRYEWVGNVLRFTPRYAFLPGIRYSARFDPRSLGPALSTARPIERTFVLASKLPEKATEVAAIYPTADLLPENQLKLYVHFSAPMSRGEAYHRVRLLDGSGVQVDRPFLELGEELWNSEMTRLTLLFDPGRIKRGLKPREEEGPILEEGKKYTFVIDRSWPDAMGHPLGTESRKSFRVGSPDDIQPDVKQWTIDRPQIGTRDPLVVHFPESLDHAMLNRAIRPKVGQTLVAGHVMVGERERSWQFVPEQPWIAGPIVLLVDPELEDLAGNSLDRPFEVDMIHPPPTNSTKSDVVVPVPSGR